ncbi:uncharacterized protein EV420DRAFT_1734160 [Desarmillaria tabescens]|uniref:Uncharacterized protein n=1 Tax=Armillaria tabescens TaxID=1929756 RepID=A0AA39MML7_ARMTA|nr:uncharacterized protein EV420DRAFT_1734160 [Desarmillaria tabescens]KAK0439294.1 hypothetical protein EV420DRAFT_1734160 [Desarmillaria tabescens]
MRLSPIVLSSKIRRLPLVTSNCGFCKTIPSIFSNDIVWGIEGDKKITSISSRSTEAVRLQHHNSKTYNVHHRPQSGPTPVFTYIDLTGFSSLSLIITIRSNPRTLNKDSNYRGQINRNDGCGRKDAVRRIWTPSKDCQNSMKPITKDVWRDGWVLDCGGKGAERDEGLTQHAQGCWVVGCRHAENTTLILQLLQIRGSPPHPQNRRRNLVQSEHRRTSSPVKGTFRLARSAGSRSQKTATRESRVTRGSSCDIVTVLVTRISSSFPIQGLRILHTEVGLVEEACF